jgi:hypothetical protein
LLAKEDKYNFTVIDQSIVIDSFSVSVLLSDVTYVKELLELNNNAMITKI